MISLYLKCYVTKVTIKMSIYIKALLYLYLYNLHKLFQSFVDPRTDTFMCKLSANHILSDRTLTRGKWGC